MTAPVTRLYLPLRPEQVLALREDRRLEPPLTAFAVTQDMRDARPDADAEEWEYAALQQAAGHAHAAGQPVIVAAADVETDQVDSGSGTSAMVEVSGTVTLPRVAALHVGDDVVADGLVIDPDSQEIELSWYDTTELDHLVGLL
jgi:hypothetical protein